MFSHRIYAVAASAAALLASAQALAADPSPWTGFYLGGHVGMLTGSAHFSDPAGATLYGNDVTTPGFAGGLQGGYNWQLDSRWVTGVEAAGSILSTQGNNTCLQSSAFVIASNCKSTPREVATFTGRLGYLTEPNGRTMIFGRGGAAWMRGDYSANPNNSDFPAAVTTTGDPVEQGHPSTMSASTWGWTIGAGVEHALSPRWSVVASYDYLRFGGASLTTPQTISAAPDGTVTSVPGGGSSAITQDMHLVKLGLNYRWGGPRAATAEESPPPPEAWAPGWEFDVGTRYWYSFGKYQGANGQPNILISRLTYDHMTGHSGEVFARLDSPFNVFIKGMIGAGGLSGGTMVDEDWGLDNAGAPESYSNTTSHATGTLNYLTADIGFNVLRGSDHKVGLFVGYNRYQTAIDTYGCSQMVETASSCNPTIANDVKIISEFDTWHSVRTGVSAEVQLWDRLKLGGEVAYLPYVFVDALDQHRLTGGNFPVQGTGNGVQAELVLSYRVTDALSFGIGGRYWSMWTNQAEQTNGPVNVFVINTERYGMFLQASYKFDVPR